MADFPPLKGEAKGGKTKLWLVQVKETKEGYGQITVKYGYEGGALQEDETLVEEGKNLGKKNETTPIEQAILMARSAWNKKQAGGYVELGAPEGGAGGKAAASAAAVSLAASRATEIDTEVPLPMLAHKWPEKAKYVKFPCFVQPKFDGHGPWASAVFPSPNPVSLAGSARPIRI